MATGRNGNGYHSCRRLEIMPWKMPSVLGMRKYRLMGADQDKAEKQFVDAVETLDDGLKIMFNLKDQQNSAGDVSLPNIVDLTMSTPVKEEPEVKNEPGTMASTPASLPMQPSKRPRSILSDLTNSTLTRSITLGSETRSLDTSASENTRPPTPAVSSPPSKIRRSTRLYSGKNTDESNV